jgi:hypothetical protein
MFKRAKKNKNMKESLFHLKNCQIKSAEKLKAVCAAIDTLEKETMIGSGRIKFTNVFICPDIDLLYFYHSSDPIERLIGGLCIRLHVKRYGKFSNKGYIKAIKKRT